MIYSWQKDLLIIPKEQILLQLYNALINTPNEIHIDQRPTEEDAKMAIENAMKNNNGIVTSFMGEKINVDFSGKEFDFSNFAKIYSPYVLHDAITKMQILGIETNSYLNRLEQEASEFGLCGRYISYYNAKDPIYDGIYFICGYDKDMILNKNLNIEEIVKTQQNHGTVKLDVHAEKLTGGSPYAIHQKIVHHCLNASTVRTLGNKFGLKSRIDTCSVWFIKNIHMLCRNSYGPKLSPVGKAENRAALENFVPAQGQKEIVTKGEGDDLDFMLHTNPERISLFKKNMVSLEDLAKNTFGIKGASFVMPKSKYKGTNFVHLEKLIYKTSQLSAVTMPVNNGKRFQEILIRECPEVLFSVARNQDKTTFVYDARYRTKIQMAYLLANKPEIYQKQFQFADLANQYDEVCTRGVHFNDIEKLFTEAEKIGIKLCLNTDVYFFAHTATASETEKGNFVYPVSFPQHQANVLQKLTDKLGINMHYEPTINQEKTHGLITVYTSLEAIDDVKKWLNQNTSIQYFQAKPVASSLSGIGAETGFGSPEKNRFSSICMVFDARYKDEVEYAFLKARRPEFFKYNLNDIRKIGEQHVLEGKAKGVGTSSFGAPSGDLERIFTNAEYYNIPICINNEKVFYNTIDTKSGINDSTYTITFPSVYTRDINSLLEQISIIDSQDRLLPQEDLRTHNYNIAYNNIEEYEQQDCR